MDLGSVARPNAVEPRELSPDFIIPDALDLRVPPAVAAAVARAAIETGVARAKISPDEVASRCREALYESTER